METMKNVLCFLNELDFFDKIKIDQMKNYDV